MNRVRLPQSRFMAYLSVGDVHYNVVDLIVTVFSQVQSAITDYLTMVLQIWALAGNHLKGYALGHGMEGLTISIYIQVR